jgi:hypothetical protein
VPETNGELVLPKSGKAAEPGGVVDYPPPTDIGGRNDLAVARSPYLRRSAASPVHWSEWSVEAFERATQLNRPILISMGSSWCNFCAAMDQTTYADPQVAEALNGAFVAIKVDKTERPDLWARYSAAYESVNGTPPARGPLTVFALSNGKPFDVLGYIPPQTQGDRIGMAELVSQASKVVREQAPDVDAAARAIESKVAGSPSPSPVEVDAKLVGSVRDAILKLSDTENGGIGTAAGPRRPEAPALMFLMQVASDTGDKAAQDAVNRTLTSYFKGGMRDNVHGGYFSGSEDSAYTKPHFEKLLTVQAGMLSVFANAYAATGRSIFKEAAGEVLRYLRETLEAEDVCFYASQAAEVDPGSPNSYHTWTAREIESVAGPGNDAKVFIKYFNIGDPGNQDGGGRSVLRATSSLKAAADSVGVTPEAAQKALDTIRKKLAKARTEQDSIPLVDKTIIAEWNATAISAYLDAYRHLGDRQAMEFAIRSMDFILLNMVSETEGIAHSFVKGKPGGYGLLAPQVHVASALVDCFEVSGKGEYIENAAQIMDFVEAKFLDGKSGLYLDRAQGGESAGLLADPRIELGDTECASANAMAAMVCHRLYQVKKDEALLNRSRRIAAAAFGSGLGRGVRAAGMARAASLIVHDPPKALVIGEDADPATAQMRSAALAAFRMGKLVETQTPQQAQSGEYPPSRDGKPIAYVCNHENCAPPVRDPAKIATVLKEFGRRPAAAADGASTATKPGSAPRRVF